MREFVELLTHPAVKLVLKALLAYYLFNAAVDRLPDPDKVGNPFAKWATGTLHTFAGNLKRAAKTLKVPGEE